jgi:hypothetical protein
MFDTNQLISAVGAVGLFGEQMPHSFSGFGLIRLRRIRSHGFAVIQQEPHHSLWVLYSSVADTGDDSTPTAKERQTIHRARI